jgi:hypothetical protein
LILGCMHRIWSTRSSIFRWVLQMVYAILPKDIIQCSRYQSINEANRSTWMPSTLLNNRARLMWQYHCHHGWRLLNTFYRYEVDLIWVWSGCEVLIISYSMSPVRTPLKILWPSPPLLEWWYGMVLWQYGCQPWLKAFKHFIGM